jgi:hypothetical protein
MAARLINYFADEMVKIVEGDQRITHEKLAEQVEGQLEKPALWKGWNPGDGLKLDRALSDWCYTPIIQSGGNYDLKSSAQSDEARLKSGVVYCSLGVRYKSYCCNVGRTYFVDPEKVRLPDDRRRAVRLSLNSRKRTTTSSCSSCRTTSSISSSKGPSSVMSTPAPPPLCTTTSPSWISTLSRTLASWCARLPTTHACPKPAQIGIEFRESAYLLGPKVTRHIREDMILNVSLGFHGIPDPKDKKKRCVPAHPGPAKAASTYQQLRSGPCRHGPHRSSWRDTAVERRVEEEGRSHVLLSGAPFSPSEQGRALTLPQQRDEKAKAGKVNGKSPAKPAGATRSAATAVVKSRLRNEGKQTDGASETRRQAHQNDLAERKQADGLAKYAEGAVDIKAAKEKAWKRFESYQREAQIPDTAADQQVLSCDNVAVRGLTSGADPGRRAQEYNHSADQWLRRPFSHQHPEERRQARGASGRLLYAALHVCDAWSNRWQEGGHGMSLPPEPTAPLKPASQPFEDASANFIRGFTFRSSDSTRFASLHEKISALKRNVVKRENERKEMADVVEQDNLIEDRQRRPITLRDTYLRPKFEGKVSTGDVEIHQNGIRWASGARSEHKVDILFNNVKHLFFQPCDQELIVVIHVTLKAPIIAGKKKVKELQFFRDASDAADETGNKKRRKQQMDEDEIEAEQEERRQRARLNREFKAFAEKIAEAVRLLMSDVGDADSRTVKSAVRRRHPVRGLRDHETSAHHGIASESSASRACPSERRVSCSRPPSAVGGESRHDVWPLMRNSQSSISLTCRLWSSP